MLATGATRPSLPWDTALSAVTRARERLAARLLGLRDHVAHCWIDHRGIVALDRRLRAQQQAALLVPFSDARDVRPAYGRRGQQAADVLRTPRPAPLVASAERGHGLGVQLAGDGILAQARSSLGVDPAYDVRFAPPLDEAARGPVEPQLC